MYLILASLVAFLVSFILLPIIIKVSKSIDLLDIPDRRKIHSIGTPSLGGIGIFIGISFSLLVAVPVLDLMELRFFLAALFIMFLMGIRDDVSSLAPKHKLLIQIFSAFVVVYFSDIRLVGLYGILGISEVPFWLSMTVSIFVIVSVTNSFNLIDGIDGLAAFIGIFTLGVFSYFFFQAGETAYVIVCLATMGSLVAFLFFNWYPSKIFMGDTGSMILGFIVATLAIHFINISTDIQNLSYFNPISGVGIAVAVLIVPIFDTIRVFFIRFINGRNPLDPDRNHLHHGLLKLGLKHSESTAVLVSVNFLFFGIGLVLNQYFSNGYLLLIIFVLAILFSSVLDYLLYKKKFLGKSLSIQGRNFYDRKPPR